MSGAAYLTTFQVQQRLSQVLTQMVSGEELPEDPCKYLAEKFRKLGAGESIEEEEVDAWKQPDVDERNEYMNEHRISIVVGVAINSLIAKLPYPENPFEALAAHFDPPESSARVEQSSLNTISQPSEPAEPSSQPSNSSEPSEPPSNNTPTPSTSSPQINRPSCSSSDLPQTSLIKSANDLAQLVKVQALFRGRGERRSLQKLRRLSNVHITETGLTKKRVVHNNFPSSFAMFSVTMYSQAWIPLGEKALYRQC